MPVYCSSQVHEDYLREALDSVAAQSFRDYELVAIDDCSPIDPAPLIESIDNLPNVRIIRNETNLRQAESRNMGVREADRKSVV